MGDVVDFKKAKDKAEEKKLEQERVKVKNARLAQKRKRYDKGRRFKPVHFFIALLIFSILYSVIRTMI